MTVSENRYDILIIGAGINGISIAREAANRGLKVLLMDQNDLASGTSSKSTQLIHGGLRYLQQYQFSMVRKSLKERDFLLETEPQCVKPLSLIMPYHYHHRPYWINRLGLWIYDILSWGSRLPRSAGIDLKQEPYHSFLKKEIHSGLIYSDAWTHDARLVLTLALEAKEEGAIILNYTRLLSVAETPSYWSVQVENKCSKQISEYRAAVMINASGPWVGKTQEHYWPEFKEPPLTWVKGSHLVLNINLPNDKAYLFECEDKRVIFLTPYEEGYSLLGTTELAYTGDLDNLKIEESEIEYLLTAANVYLEKPLTRADIVHSFSGVRPLLRDPKHSMHALSRDYHLDWQWGAKGRGVLSVLGGKLTTHHRLALDALQQLAPHFQNLSNALEIPNEIEVDQKRKGKKIASALEDKFRKQFYFLPEFVIRRYLKTYGVAHLSWLNSASCFEDLGQHFGAGLYQLEVDYLIENEWAKTVEDILWRRTRLGLYQASIDLNSLDTYLTKAIEGSNTLGSANRAE